MRTFKAVFEFEFNEDSADLVVWASEDCKDVKISGPEQIIMLTLIQDWVSAKVQSWQEAALRAAADNWRNTNAAD